MSHLFEGYTKEKDFLICVDSDGCAMDTMEVKHRKCFAPQLIEVFELQHREEEVNALWLELNLYSLTRGINRFKGLAKTLETLNKNGASIVGLEIFLKWVDETDELSNPALQRKIKEEQEERGQACDILNKVLRWSLAVNEAIKALPEEDQPYDHVKEVLENISQVGDICVVSSANGEALEHEWQRHDLKKYLKRLLGQEAGTKAICIKKLKEAGYEQDKILMVGDAIGDLEAARQNEVRFYPILVGQEGLAWKRLQMEAIPKLLEGSFDENYQNQLIDEMKAILK